MGSFPETYNDPDIDTRGKFDTDTPGHWIPNSLSVELGLRIVDYGFRSLMGLLELYSGFQKPRFQILQQLFAGFRNPNSITWGEYLVINQNQLTNLNILCSSRL